jgi:hypothetical protein
LEIQEHSLCLDLLVLGLALLGLALESVVW